MAACDHCASPETGATDPQFRRILWLALAVNALMFVVEITASWLSGSMALQADALDFLGDSFNYAISLVVLGMGLRARAGAALVKGATMPDLRRQDGAQARARPPRERIRILDRRMQGTAGSLRRPESVQRRREADCDQAAAGDRQETARTAVAARRTRPSCQRLQRRSQTGLPDHRQLGRPVRRCDEAARCRTCQCRGNRTLLLAG